MNHYNPLHQISIHSMSIFDICGCTSVHLYIFMYVRVEYLVSLAYNTEFFSPGNFIISILPIMAIVPLRLVLWYFNQKK